LPALAKRFVPNTWASWTACKLWVVFAYMAARLDWIRRHKASFVWLPLLAVIGAGAHFLARYRMEQSGRHFAFMDPITVRHIPMIDAMHAHLGYAFGYAAVFLGTLLWLEWRKAPRWIVWASFGILAVPSLDYTWACIALGTRFAVYNP
jgi:hypothetical protein